MSRRQLPPQIKKIVVAVRTTGKQVVRYQVTVDGGINPETGARQQARRRQTTEREARAALAEIADAQATFVPRLTITLREVCENYFAGRPSCVPPRWRSGVMTSGR